MNGPSSATARLILGTAGPIGSGKSAVSRWLEGSPYGFRIISLSATLRKILDALGKEPVRENFVIVANALRDAFPERGAYLAESALAAVHAHERSDPGGLYVIEGIRWPETHARLRALSNYRLLHVTAPQPLRYERVRNRGEKEGEAGMSWERFRQEEQMASEIELASFLSDADFRIENDGSENDLYAAVDNYLESLEITIS